MIGTRVKLSLFARINYLINGMILKLFTVHTLLSLPHTRARVTFLQLFSCSLFVVSNEQAAPQAHNTQNSFSSHTICVVLSLTSSELKNDWQVSPNEKRHDMRRRCWWQWESQNKAKPKNLSKNSWGCWGFPSNSPSFA